MVQQVPPAKRPSLPSPGGRRHARPQGAPARSCCGPTSERALRKSRAAYDLKGLSRAPRRDGPEPLAASTGTWIAQYNDGPPAPYRGRHCARTRREGGRVGIKRRRSRAHATAAICAGHHVRAAATGVLPSKLTGRPEWYRKAAGRAGVPGGASTIWASCSPRARGVERGRDASQALAHRGRRIRPIRRLPTRPEAAARAIGPASGRRRRR